jgi:hypothetical protein
MFWAFQLAETGKIDDHVNVLTEEGGREWNWQILKIFLFARKQKKTSGWDNVQFFVYFILMVSGEKSILCPPFTTEMLRNSPVGFVTD